MTGMILAAYSLLSQTGCDTPETTSEPNLQGKSREEQTQILTKHVNDSYTLDKGCEAAFKLLNDGNMLAFRTLGNPEEANAVCDFNNNPWYQDDDSLIGYQWDASTQTFVRVDSATVQEALPRPTINVME